VSEAGDPDGSAYMSGGQRPKSCGAWVRSWHFRDIAMSWMDFRFRWKSGRAADITAKTGFDPKATSASLNPAAQQSPACTEVCYAFNNDRATATAK
jgi:hypothetical protein